MNRLTRRAALLTSTIGAALWGSGHGVRAAIRTPDQTAGPFYPRPEHRPADQDWDLVKIDGAIRAAGGEILHLAGRVIDESGAPLPETLIEIWQCDANGRYLHPADRNDSIPRDAAFQGYGAAMTDAAGGYAFRAIRPVPYPGRAPHIHARVSAPGRRTLTTQIYVADDPRNDRDGVYRRLGAVGQAAASMRLARRDDGGLDAMFDFVV